MDFADAGDLSKCLTKQRPSNQIKVERNKWSMRLKLRIKSMSKSFKLKLNKSLDVFNKIKSKYKE